MRKAVLITGGAKRLGNRIAIALARIGYDIALHYNSSREDAEKARREITSLDVICEIFKADLSQESDLIPKVYKKFPDLEILINNASIFESSPIKETSVELWQRHLSVNLTAPFWLSRDFAKICRKGHIINILDTRINSNRTTYAAYSISKKALCDLTMMCAVEFAPHIRVNGIAPGLILPPEGKDDTYLDRLAKNIPMQRKGSPENITASIEFLLKNYYTTGQIIFNDGGEHLK